MEMRELTGVIVEAALEVHRVLRGPGLLESVYEEALAAELALRGCIVRRQEPVIVWYKGNPLSTPLRIDLLVNDVVIVECKAVTKYNPLFTSQALTYLRLSRRTLALVINFGERSLRQGIHRVVDHHAD